MSINNEYRNTSLQSKSVLANLSVGGSTPRLQLKGAASWAVITISTSSLAFKVQGLAAGGGWIDLDTITPTVSTIERGNAVGFTDFRLLATAGSGQVEFRVSQVASSEVTFSGTISGSGLATETKQDTQITALQLIDDSIFADDAAFTIGSSKVTAIGGVVDETSTDSADEGDAVALRATANRQLRVHPPGAEPQTGLSIASGSNQTIVLNGAPGLAVEVTAIDTTPTITVTGILASGGTARNIECIQMTGGYGRLRVGGTTISLAAADRLYIIGDYYSVTLTYAGGTSATVTTRTMTQTAANKILAAPIELKPLSNQNIANGTLDDAGGTNLTVPTGATGAWITLIETTLGTPAVVYMTTDGGTPSATDGATIKCTNLPFEMSGRDLIAAAKFLAPDAGSRLSAEFFEEVIRIG